MKLRVAPTGSQNRYSRTALMRCHGKYYPIRTAATTQIIIVIARKPQSRPFIWGTESPKRLGLSIGTMPVYQASFGRATPCASVPGVTFTIIAEICAGSTSAAPIAVVTDDFATNCAVSWVINKVWSIPVPVGLRFPTKVRS